jgi:hypothetical protein
LKAAEEIRGAGRVKVAGVEKEIIESNALAEAKASKIVL